MIPGPLTPARPELPTFDTEGDLRLMGQYVNDPHLPLGDRAARLDLIGHEFHPFILISQSWKLMICPYSSHSCESDPYAPTATSRSSSAALRAVWYSLTNLRCRQLRL